MNTCWEFAFDRHGQCMSMAAVTGPRRGSLSSRSKITEADVVTMRREFAAGDSLAAIGRKYGISDTQVFRIAIGKSWAHVPFEEAGPTKASGFKRGEQSGNVKLRRAGVIDIRRAASAGETQASIAKRHGVSVSTVADIVAGKSWAHVPEGLEHIPRDGRDRYRRGESHPKSKLTAQQAAEIREHYAGGSTLESIGKAYGVSATSIGRIVNGTSWKQSAPAV